MRWGDRIARSQFIYGFAVTGYLSNPNVSHVTDSADSSPNAIDNSIASAVRRFQFRLKARRQRQVIMWEEAGIQAADGRLEKPILLTDEWHFGKRSQTTC